MPIQTTLTLADAAAFNQHKRETLDKFHKYLGENYTRLRQKGWEFRKFFFEYLNNAKEAGILLEDAINHHKVSVYEDSKQIRKDTSGGQLPGVIIFSNTSNEYSYQIFSEGVEYVNEKKELVGGAFGATNPLGTSTSDFVASAYINNHLIHEKYQPVPYELFLFSYGSKNERKGETVQKVAYEAFARREKFIEDWGNAGHYIGRTKEGVPYRVMATNDGLAETYFPVLLHDLKECRYYVVIGDDFVPFENWASNNSRLKDNEIVKKHIQALKMHRQEAYYFHELTNMIRSRKGFYCVDSRQKRPDAVMYKDLGAIPTKRQREHILQRRDIKYLVICLHYKCGDITGVIQVHEMGKEMKEIFEAGMRNGKEHDVEQLKNFFEIGVRKIFNNTLRGFDYKTLIGMIKRIDPERIFSETTQKVLKGLFESHPSDMRDAVFYMKERDILEWDDENGTIVMPAAAYVDKLYKEKRLNSAEYNNCVVRSVAWHQEKIWKEDAQASNSPITIRVQIEDFSNGEIISVYDNNLNIIDAIDGRFINFGRNHLF